MKKTDIKIYPDKDHVFLLGIGGIGMSALARYFLLMGKKVAGYDKTETDLTKLLTKEGIQIHYEDNTKKIPAAFLKKDKSLIIYTPAIPKDNLEYNFFLDQGFQLLKRSVVLGEISRNYKTVAIAGTHGKTTTSSILTHILQSSGKKILAFVGGINKNNSSNVVIQKKAELLITEADEYDKSFLTLHPDILLVTSLDADHLDIYNTEEEVKKSYLSFASQLNENGHLITPWENGKWFEGSPMKTYGIIKGDYKASNLKITNGQYQFDFLAPGGSIKNCLFPYPGIHNLENAIGAMTIAKLLGVPDSSIKKSLTKYKGVKRRFDIQYHKNDVTYIDDYAHHPKEITACITAARSFYPNKKITGIFQPHLFTRTRDFLNGFAQSLSLFDEIVLLDIYPAREKPIEGINSSILLERIKISEKFILQKSEVVDWLKNRDIQVLITIGAGDIDTLVQPITKLIKQKYD